MIESNNKLENYNSKLKSLNVELAKAKSDADDKNIELEAELKSKLLLLSDTRKSMNQLRETVSDLGDDIINKSRLLKIFI